MVNTYANSCSINAAVLPKQVIEVLGWLQAQTTNCLPNSVYIYDLIDQYTPCSSGSVAEMLGYTPDEVESLDALGLGGLIHPADLQLVSDHFQRFTTLCKGEVIAIEYRMQRSDGTWCWLRSQEASLIQAIDGFPLQVLGLVQDITQLVTTNTKYSANTKHPTNTKYSAESPLTQILNLSN
jgi:PAS domain S-box-containing protein